MSVLLYVSILAMSTQLHCVLKARINFARIKGCGAMELVEAKCRVCQILYLLRGEINSITGSQIIRKLGYDCKRRLAENKKMSSHFYLVWPSVIKRAREKKRRQSFWYRALGEEMKLLLPISGRYYLWFEWWGNHLNLKPKLEIPIQGRAWIYQTMSSLG